MLFRSPCLVDGDWCLHSDAVSKSELQGRIVNTITSPCLVEEVGMDFDRETMPGWMGLPDPTTLPDRPFEIDYVRSWRAA